jgi:hypothetical protein
MSPPACWPAARSGRRCRRARCPPSSGNVQLTDRRRPAVRPFVLDGCRRSVSQPSEGPCSALSSTRARNTIGGNPGDREEAVPGYFSAPCGVRGSLPRPLPQPYRDGYLNPTVMGTLATAYLWEPSLDVIVGHHAQGAASRAVFANDAAPLRYVGVPPTCREDRTRTLHDRARPQMRAPGLLGR